VVAFTSLPIIWSYVFRALTVAFKSWSVSLNVDTVSFRSTAYWLTVAL